MTHYVQMLPDRKMIETYRCGDLEASHRTDAMRSLFRLMVKAGLSGPARIHNQAGMHVQGVAKIEDAAQFCLSESPSRGFVFSKFQELDPAVLARFKGRR